MADKFSLVLPLFHYHTSFFSLSFTSYFSEPLETHPLRNNALKIHVLLVRFTKSIYRMSPFILFSVSKTCLENMSRVRTGNSGQMKLLYRRGRAVRLEYKHRTTCSRHDNTVAYLWRKKSEGGSNPLRKGSFHTILH